MSKSNILTEEEFSRFKPSRRILEYIEAFGRESGLENKDIRILDWGCGRGRAVLWLRGKGYNAFGIEVDKGPIENAAPLFRTRGHDPAVLQLLSPNGKTSFSDDFFHITFSSQVFEHVEDLDGVARELFRITRGEGIGFHTYPARKHLVEAHLKMPFIHWLPKNIVRRTLIALFVLAGREPRWPGLRSPAEKTDAYYRYSIGKTFYRKQAETQAVFSRNGFRVSFECINDPLLARYVGSIAKGSAMKTAINQILTEFLKVELLITKPPAGYQNLQK